MRHGDDIVNIGNSAKAKILTEIVSVARKRHHLLVFDYGCGEARYWRPVLKAYPNIELIGYDPDARVIQKARKHVGGFPCHLYTGRVLNKLDFQADFIVSFSVLEHVYNREEYLRHAKRLLAPGGTFYLNYDDGHFRIKLDLGEPRTWPKLFCSYLHNVLAPLLAAMGLTNRFQSRVRREYIDRLVSELGFKVDRVFYSNLECFKGLVKYVPKEKQSIFLRRWINIENQLNEEFTCELGEFCGDTVNLWRFMGSRTLVLRHG